jgi:hypothetical protein
MSIPDINYLESKAILELFATLKHEGNRFSKLCFSDDGKNVGIETSSSIYRTTLSTVNYVTNLLNQTAQDYGFSTSDIFPKGWNRDIQSLIPITQRIAEEFTTHDLNEQDALVGIDLMAEAIGGLNTLQQNQYNDSSQEEKQDIIRMAASALEGARTTLVNNYSKSRSTLSIDTIREKSFEKENEDLLKIIQQLQEENDRLRQVVKMKDKKIEKLQSSPSQLSENSILDDESTTSFENELTKFGQTFDKIHTTMKTYLDEQKKKK